MTTSPQLTTFVPSALMGGAAPLAASSLKRSACVQHRPAPSSVMLPLSTLEGDKSASVSDSSAHGSCKNLTTWQTDHLGCAT